MPSFLLLASLRIHCNGEVNIFHGDGSYLPHKVESSENFHSVVRLERHTFDDTDVSLGKSMRSVRPFVLFYFSECSSSDAISQIASNERSACRTLSTAIGERP